MKTTGVMYKNGIILPYLGQEYILEVRVYRSYQKPGVMEEGRKLVVLTARPDGAVVEKAVREWYAARAKQIIEARVERYCREMGETVGAVRIKNVKSRWGSCSSKRNLNFNWRLVMAPMEVLDYVVVHELCHLREMNHSASFWALVRNVLPDYEARSEWLKTCGLIQQFQ